MKPVAGYMTVDKVFHRTASEAVAHLNTLYDGYLAELAREITQMPAGVTTKYIEKNLFRFRRLSDIKDDLTVEPD